MSKRITLLDQWNQINQRIDDISQEFIDKYFQGKEKPTVIYFLASYQGIAEQKVTGFSIFRQGRPYLFGKRPTKILLDELWKWSAAFVPDVKDIRINYEHDLGTYKVKGAHRLEEIDDKRLSYHKGALLPGLEELKSKYEPREGYAACTYCRKQVPIESMVECTVIARQYSGMKKTSKYCSKICGSHDQMAHEG